MLARINPPFPWHEGEWKTENQDRGYFAISFVAENQTHSLLSSYYKHPDSRFFCAFPNPFHWNLASFLTTAHSSKF